MTAFAVALLVLANIALLVLLVMGKLRRAALEKAIAPYPSHLLDALGRLNRLIDNPDLSSSLEDWTSYAIEAIGSDIPHEDVVLVSRCMNDEGNDIFTITVSSGNGPLGCSSSENKTPFNSQIRRHFFWSKEPQVIHFNALSQCFPEEYACKYNSALAGVFDVGGNESALILLQSQRAQQYSMEDKRRFESVFRVIRAGYGLINFHMAQTMLHEEIDRAHEEGMLQISTGIIHNIGNGILVIKIAMDRIGDLKSLQALANFLKDEVIVGQQKLLDSGSLDSRAAKEYLDTAFEVASKLSHMLADLASEFKEICSKFQSIIETITLQQQFIGELGTEDVVPVGMIVEDALKMSETPLANNGIQLEKKINSQSNILADAALLRQVMLSLIKSMINSVNKTKRQPAVIKVSCHDSSAADVGQEGDNNYVCLELRDNGYGVMFTDDPAKSRGKSPAAQELRELMFCRNKIAKYRGFFKVESVAGSGTVIRLGLPTLDIAEKPGKE
ncbi:MAG: HAMP domain-containing histidine kinase [Victivallales bacterium]|nr:HAMP domain-containing histidine kinase [Victivallales bacterium]